MHAGFGFGLDCAIILSAILSEDFLGEAPDDFLCRLPATRLG